MKSTLFMLIGLPASGKSTFAKTLENESTIILSSDKIREEVLGSESDQSNNKLVFKVLYEKLRKALAGGKNVVLDATNITKKNRAQALKAIEDIDAIKYAIVLKTNPETCFIFDEQRERHVSKEIIEKYAKIFEYPSIDEGFDKIFEYEPGYKND